MMARNSLLALLALSARTMAAPRASVRAATSSSSFSRCRCSSPSRDWIRASISLKSAMSRPSSSSPRGRTRRA
ncbi:MAG: hypothetical protein ABSH53_12055 [Holophaga sp.]